MSLGEGISKLTTHSFNANVISIFTIEFLPSHLFKSRSGIKIFNDIVT